MEVELIIIIIILVTILIIKSVQNEFRIYTLGTIVQTAYSRNEIAGETTYYFDVQYKNVSGVVKAKRIVVTKEVFNFSLHKVGDPIIVYI